MTGRRFGVGVIGCGLIGRKRILNLPGTCGLVSVFDVDTAAANNAVSLSDDGATVAGSVEELLREPTIDIVIVATNHLGLAETAVKAVEHGKHVLIEKPGGISAEALSRVGEAVRKNGSVVHVGYNHRFHPSMLMARDIVRSGAHGGLLWIRARYGHGGRLGYDKEWRAEKAISGGGELLDQGSHLIDLTRFFFGESSLAYSRLETAYWDMEVEDNAFLALEPRSGGTAWLHASWTEWKNTFSLEIALRTAKIDITGLGGSYGPETLTLYEMQPEMGPPPSRTHTWDASDVSWRLEIEDFVAAIGGAEPIGATLHDALATLDIIGKAYAT